MISSEDSEDLDCIVWMTSPEAQVYLRISKTTLYECMKDGRLPYYHVKGTRQRRIKKSDLGNLMIMGNVKNTSVDD